MVDLGIEGLQDAEPLGSGGFGTVYRARQPRLSRDVAVKVLPRTTGDETAELRFQREAAALGVLARHPNIVTVYDTGMTADGRPYLIMELVGRGSLADEIAADGPMSWGRVLEIGIRLAGALGSAHSAGILHRDIKPANVLVSDFGEPMLADFGIARVEGAGQTSSATITGSAAHLAPELLHGEPPSVASDLYALGSTLFEALAGTAAFVRSTDQTIAAAYQRILTAPVPDLRPQGIPDAVCALLERLLDKSPTGRFDSAAEVGEALRELQREAGMDVTPLLVAEEVAEQARSAAASGATATHPVGTGIDAGATADGQATAAGTSPPGARKSLDTGTDAEGPQPVPVPPRRRGSVLAVGGLGLAAVVVVGAVLFTGGGSGDDGNDPVGGDQAATDRATTDPTITPTDGGSTSSPGPSTDDVDVVSAFSSSSCTALAVLGAPAGGDGSADAPFGTISDLLADIQPGGTACVGPGRWDEPVVLGAAQSGTTENVVTLRGLRGGTTVLAGGVEVSEGGSNITLSHLDVTDAGTGTALTVRARPTALWYVTLSSPAGTCLDVDVPAPEFGHSMSMTAVILRDCGTSALPGAIVRGDATTVIANNVVMHDVERPGVGFAVRDTASLLASGMTFIGQATPVTMEPDASVSLSSTLFMGLQDPLLTLLGAFGDGHASVTGTCLSPPSDGPGADELRIDAGAFPDFVTIEPETVAVAEFVDLDTYAQARGSGCDGFGALSSILELRSL